ncbi:larval cuticle protein 65Ag1-like [Pectinophora gossypiella]|uniref:larval cuticle protein 65Ag1-like n=1 Tax=Pectinophora gossypiella TaxID=13191 RepID=UPI00214E0BA9|nr:larval cuticle protein 65Ag1-like [Pectinophora gossypiella]XP_049865985.1 larval cuticle protein 65Ag1-like [Pectinophora gossypiella]
MKLHNTLSIPRQDIYSPGCHFTAETYRTPSPVNTSPVKKIKMMKITVFAIAALALVCALPQQDAPAQGNGQPPVSIVKQDSEVDVNGYNFEFETSDGTSRQEQGEYKNDTDQQGLSVKGSYKYTAPDGQKISVTFLADKNGYQPTEQKDDQKSAPQA